MRTSTKFLARAISLVATSAVWSPPAIAAAPVHAAVDAAEVAGEAVEIAAGMENDTTSIEAVSVPIEAGQPVVLSHAETGIDIGIGLPTATSVGAPEVVEGDAVYVDESQDTSFVVDAIDDGVRVMSVLETPDAPTRIDYLLEIPDGAELLERADGSVDVGFVADGIQVVIATLDAPWAVDARGKAVDTSFEVHGTALTQTVRPGVGATYPITADPTLKWKLYGAVVYFNRDETREQAFQAGACLVISEVFPGAIKTAFKLACGAVALVAADAMRRSNQCLRFTYLYVPVGGSYPWRGTC